MRLGFIGTGTIASATVRGLIGGEHQITVSERGAAHASRLAAEFENVNIADNQGVINQSDTIFIGLMAETAPDILSRLTFRADQRVISFMAGLPLDALAPLVAPAHGAAIMLPFPGIAQGGTPIIAMGDTGFVAALFSPENQVFALCDAAELDAYLCAQAVLSPATRMVEQAAEWLAARVSDPAQGEAFLRMLIGTNLVSSPCGDLLEALNTPGGYNQRLRQHMDAAGMGDDLVAGLDRLESGD
ncbi:pyrroline-5-carboxylate reductase [Roseovarius gaetbuli]|uniref:Pyrroline-5-carboxylate reductase n=1 Tax=Roseovarius gaetbuli TaxID=1356575 RepID=A0A1X6ZHE5_9RHOB|nr:NAD(P)-binding domain-containing protein [Roseovarius gaetbuli]SLN50960.1 pyrroline-5-carboxylate reductase [Roseovarius gaetbuli]